MRSSGPPPSGGGSPPSIPQSCTTLVGNRNAQTASLAGKQVGQVQSGSPAECCDACKLSSTVRRALDSLSTTFCILRSKVVGFEVFWGCW